MKHFLTADYKAEMIEQSERFPRLRDRAIFVGNPDDIVPQTLGPDLPSIRAWTEQHYDFSGYITGFDHAAFTDREAIRAELGYAYNEKICIVAGPRIDPQSLPNVDGIEVRGYVYELYRHLAVCDLAVVQGGLATTMELTANKRPCLYFPLRHHFEQIFHVRHRLDRHHTGRCMDLAGNSRGDRKSYR